MGYVPTGEAGVAVVEMSADPLTALAAVSPLTNPVTV
jgi:hypothetical protein